MTTLLLSTWSLPAANALAATARQRGWQVRAFPENLSPTSKDRIVFYGGTDVALEVSARYGLALMEPALDQLARLPADLRKRSVEFARFGDIGRLSGPTFIKPADPIHKLFDAGVYSDVSSIRAPAGVPASLPVLVAEPVNWLAEYRCWICEGRVAASSPYLSFGRPIWKPFCVGKTMAQESPHVRAFCERMLAEAKETIPPAFVMDVGLIEDRGWAVVEFNPAWCASLLGADPQPAIDVIARASTPLSLVTPRDRRWLVARHS